MKKPETLNEIELTDKDELRTKAITFFEYALKKQMNPYNTFLRFFNLLDEENRCPNEDYHKLRKDS